MGFLCSKLEWFVEQVYISTLGKFSSRLTLNIEALTISFSCWHWVFQFLFTLLDLMVFFLLFCFLCVLDFLFLLLTVFLPLFGDIVYAFIFLNILLFGFVFSAFLYHFDSLVPRFLFFSRIYSVHKFLLTFSFLTISTEFLSFSLLAWISSSLSFPVLFSFLTFSSILSFSSFKFCFLFFSYIFYSSFLILLFDHLSLPCISQLCLNITSPDCFLIIIPHFHQFARNDTFHFSSFFPSLLSWCWKNQR